MTRTTVVGLHNAMGAALRRARIERGLRQKDVAAHVGVNRAMVGHYEAGRYSLSAANILGIVEALGLRDAGELFELAAQEEERRNADLKMSA